MMKLKLFELSVTERERLAKEEPHTLERIFRDDVQSIISTLSISHQERAQKLQEELDEMRSRFEPGNLELVGYFVQKAVQLVHKNREENKEPSTVQMAMSPLGVISEDIH